MHDDKCKRKHRYAQRSLGPGHSLYKYAAFRLSYDLQITSGKAGGWLKDGRYLWQSIVAGARESSQFQDQSRCARRAVVDSLASLADVLVEREKAVQHRLPRYRFVACAVAACYRLLLFRCSALVSYSLMVTIRSTAGTAICVFAPLGQ
jgi:hypothetical protein